MNKYQWKQLVRKTAYASGKKKLTNKELLALQDSVLALKKQGVELPFMKKVENWKEKGLSKIGDILGR